jgi:hypothetical protein
LRLREGNSIVHSDIVTCKAVFGVGSGRRVHPCFSIRPNQLCNKYVGYPKVLCIDREVYVLLLFFLRNRGHQLYIYLHIFYFKLDLRSLMEYRSIECIAAYNCLALHQTVRNYTRSTRCGTPCYSHISPVEVGFRDFQMTSAQ